MVMPSSSCSSRRRACSTVSPASSLPPGNSHQPARTLPGGRLVSSRAPSSSRIKMPTATSVRRTAVFIASEGGAIAETLHIGNACVLLHLAALGIACGVIARKLLGHTTAARAALQRPDQRLGLGSSHLLGAQAQAGEPLHHHAQV